MGLNLSKIVGNSSGLDAPLLEPGGYPARLVQLIDLGLQPNTFNGEEKAPAYQAWFTYELTDEFMTDEDGQPVKDKPRWVSETLNLFNLHSEKAKVAQRFKALDPDGTTKGDLSQCLGRPVLVTIVHNPNKKNPAKPYENVGGVSVLRPKDAAKLPSLVNPPRIFDLDSPDMEVFNSLPDFLRAKIVANLEFKGSKLDKLINLDGGHSTHAIGATLASTARLAPPADSVHGYVSDDEEPPF